MCKSLFLLAQGNRTGAGQPPHPQAHPFPQPRRLGNHCLYNLERDHLNARWVWVLVRAMPPHSLPCTSTRRCQWGGCSDALFDTRSEGPPRASARGRTHHAAPLSSHPEQVGHHTAARRGQLLLLHTAPRLARPGEGLITFTIRSAGRK